MIRRSIVDLSQDPSPSASDNKSTAASMASSKKGSQPKRLVASKRKPCGTAANRSGKSASPDKKRRHDGDDGYCGKNKKQKTTSDTVIELPGARIAVKEFRRRSCAVYEPAVTLRALSAIQPMFFVSFVHQFRKYVYLGNLQLWFV